MGRTPSARAHQLAHPSRIAPYPPPARQSAGGHASFSGHHGGRRRGGIVCSAGLVGQLVAHAEDSLDVARPRGVGLDLAPDVLDVSVDRPFVRLECVAVDRVEQLGAREDSAGLGAPGWPAGRTRSPSGRPLPPRTRTSRRSRSSSRSPTAKWSVGAVDCWARRRTARTRATSSLRAEGLGQVVVGAQLEPDDLVRLVDAGGQHDDRDVRVSAQ